MSDSKNPDAEPAQKTRKGLAALFNQSELKKFFIIYLVFIFIIEILILFFCFLSQLPPYNLPFPWKLYCVSAFVVPIAITFLVGIFVSAFNVFVFGNQSEKPKIDGDETPASPSGQEDDTGKISGTLKVIRQIPFLLGLLLLGMGMIIFSQFDHIISFMAQSGSQIFSYLFIVVAIVAGFSMVFGIIWLVLNYKLHKEKMKYQFKKDIMKQLGVIMTDDNQIINLGIVENKLIDNDAK